MDLDTDTDGKDVYQVGRTSLSVPYVNNGHEWGMRSKSFYCFTFSKLKTIARYTKAQNVNYQRTTYMLSRPQSCSSGATKQNDPLPRDFYTYSEDIADNCRNVDISPDDIIAIIHSWFLTIWGPRFPDARRRSPVKAVPLRQSIKCPSLIPSINQRSSLSRCL